MSDFTGLNLKNLVMNFKKEWVMNKYYKRYEEVIRVDKATFLNDNANAASIFKKLDFNNDGYITENEFQMIKYSDRDGDGSISEGEYAEYKDHSIEQALFFARRNIDKWFSVDINRDGHWSNVENRLARYRMSEDDPTKEHQLDASMTNEELANKYNMTEKIKKRSYSLDKWIDSWAKTIKKDIQRQYGIELSDADMVKVKKEMIKQLNTWLFKTGDNATQDAPLYQSLCNDAYTRLVTNKATVSCCGGDVTPPPSSSNKATCDRIFRSMEISGEDFKYMEQEFRELDSMEIPDDMTEEEFDKYRYERMTEIVNKYEPVNTAEEVRNRLTWAIYAAPQKAVEINEQINRELIDKIKSGEITPDQAAEADHAIWARMSDEEYAQYHEQFMNIKNMTASDFRELLKPDNEAKRLDFENKSNMTVSQIVQYIDIVESVTGVDFDSDDWQIDSKQFFDIVQLINDTKDDAQLLEGKTREDVPENRQDLLRFLEEKGWLYEQFKI